MSRHHSNPIGDKPGSPALSLVAIVARHMLGRADSGDCKGHNRPHRGEGERCGDRKMGRQLPGDIKPPGC